jgi:DNA-binding CsgD family transcriptional regulator
VPSKNLTPSLFRAWLRQEAKRIAADLIRDGALDHFTPVQHSSSSAWSGTYDLLPLLDAKSVRAGLDALRATQWRRLRVGLSRRERELAELLRRGVSRAEAADVMRLHASTVKTLYTRIVKKAIILR